MDNSHIRDGRHNPSLDEARETPEEQSTNSEAHLPPTQPGLVLSVVPSMTTITEHPSSAFVIGAPPDGGWVAWMSGRSHLKDTSPQI
jgi:hypothetical protein